MSGWISVEERMPEVERCGKKDCPWCAQGKCCNCVLAFYRPERLATYLPNPQVCATAYFARNKDDFTHWMPLPVPPGSAQ